MVGSSIGIYINSLVACHLSWSKMVSATLMGHEVTYHK